MTDPIEWAAQRIAVRLKTMNPAIEAHTDDIRFGAAYYINYYGVIVVSLIIGLISHQLLPTVLSLLSIGILRRYTGGYHLPTLTLCFVGSIGLICALPHFSLGLNTIYLLTLISLGIAWRTVKDPTNRRLALAMIGTNFWFGSSIVALAFFIQTLSLLPAGEVVKPNETTTYEHGG